MIGISYAKSAMSGYNIIVATETYMYVDGIELKDTAKGC